MASTIPARLVRQLCTAQEAALVSASRERGVKDDSPAKLLRKLERARALRDKFRDLAERQRREARGKQAPRRSVASKGNDRTLLKQQLFAETVENLERRLSAAERAGSRAGERRAATSGKRDRTQAKRSSRQAVRKGLQAELNAGVGAVKSRRSGKGIVKAAGTRAGRDGAASASSAAASAPARSSGGKTSAAPPKTSRQPSARANARSSGKTGQGRAKSASASLGSGGVGLLGADIAGTPSAAGFKLAGARRGEATTNRNLSLAAHSAIAATRQPEQRFERTGSRKHLAHIGARNRRHQAKRDSGGAR